LDNTLTNESSTCLGASKILTTGGSPAPIVLETHAGPTTRSTEHPQ
jgi:hypothetical protein